MADKVFLIGLDAAEWSIIEQCIDEGDMPHLGKLVSVGTRVRMEAPETYKAEGRWSEFLTATDAPSANYWSINEFDPYSYTPWYARSSHGSYFYARPDLKSIIFDVPNSVLVEDMPGIQLFGWGAHATQFPTSSQPPSVMHKIDTRFGVHEGMLSDGHHGWNNEDYLDELQAAMEKGVDQRVQICKWLDAEYPDWDMFAVVFGESHVAEHQYLHGFDPTHPLHDLSLAPGAGQRLRDTFRKLDDAIGELVDTFGERASVVPFAVHGMQKNASDVIGGVLLPELIHRQHFGDSLLDFPEWHQDDPYLVLDPRVQPRHYLESILKIPTPTTCSGLRSLPTKAVRALRHRLPAERLNDFEKRYWKRPDWWNMHIRPVTPPQRRDVYTEAQWIEMESAASASWYRTYWPQMDYFVVPSFSDCHIRINLVGRERDGRVPLADYEATLDRIEADLRNVVNPRTGVPVFGDFYRVRADDPFSETGPAPDLVVTAVEVADVIEHPEVGNVGSSPLMRMGEHSRNAWALFPNEAGSRESAEVYEPKDLPATLLEILGRVPGPSVSGRSFAQELGPR